MCTWQALVALLWFCTISAAVLQPAVPLPLLKQGKRRCSPEFFERHCEAFLEYSGSVLSMVIMVVFRVSFWICLCFSFPWWVKGSSFPLPLGGGRGTTSSPAIKKKKRDENASTLPDLFRSLSRCSEVCIKEIALFSSIVALSTTLLVDAFVVCSTQKKKTHERCTCYAASLSAMVEPDSTFLRSSTCCSRWTKVCGEGFW